MKHLILIALLFCAFNLPAQDNDMWMDFTDEQRMVFLIGFMYGVYTEAEEDLYGINDVEGEDITSLMHLTTVAFLYDPEITLRDAIMKALKVLKEHKPKPEA